MKLLTPEIRAQLLRNGELAARRAEGREGSEELIPVVKFFTPDAACTWLLTELDPRDPAIAFGLCDLGLGCPELGLVRMSELQSVRGRRRFPIERDLYFKPTHPVGVYARAARKAGAITQCAQALADAASANEVAAYRPNRCASSGRPADQDTAPPTADCQSVAGNDSLP